MKKPAKHTPDEIKEAVCVLFKAGFSFARVDAILKLRPGTAERIVMKEMRRRRG